MTYHSLNQFPLFCKVSNLTTRKGRSEFPFPAEVGDYDTDGVADLMVKFNRQDLIAILGVGEVTLTITGEVDETSFEGSDTIQVIGE